jgi:hypothetical protein
MLRIDSYMTAYRKTPKREKRLVSSVFKWMDSLATPEITAATPALYRLMRTTHFRERDTMNVDWKFLKSGGPDHLPIFERCLLNGTFISCNWAHNGLACNDNNAVSLELLSILQARSKCPTILSWWVQDDKGEISQRFGIPSFFLRLDYTSSCIDQAYACMLHIPSPDAYRK